jgi:2-C-methyl-D-erythritol 4-phosphate cytidylyltransferase
MRASAIIVAAGSGTRLGLETPKAFVRLANRSLLARALETLKPVAAIGEAVITVPAGMERAARAEVAAAGLEIPVKITIGGAERQDSVRIALALTSAEAEIVVIHDAARPFATAAMYENCIATAARAGAAIVALALADTLKKVEGHTIIATVPRAGLWLAQTPQAFGREMLISAHERALRERIGATDDADLAEQCGATVEIVEGSALNFKITTADDLALANALAAQSILPRARGD